MTDTMEKEFNSITEHMHTMLLAFVVALIVIYFTIDWLTKKTTKFPPGPLCLPIIGNSPFIPKTHLYTTMSGEWRKKYGPLVGIVLRKKKMVAVCGPQEVLEVLKREEFQGRPKDHRARSFNKCIGVFFSDGEYWQEQRRFLLRHLRDFGFGKKSMEGFIMEEVEDVLKEMGDLEVFQANTVFAVSTVNVLWGMIAGTRYSRDDTELQELLRKLNLAFRASSPTGGGLISRFPLLKRLIHGQSRGTGTLNTLSDLQNFFQKSIKHHEQTIDENNPRDFTDVYLKEMKIQSNKPDTTFTEEGLITIYLDMFSAGSETMVNFLAFSLQYMVLHTDVQKKVQKELDDVLGQNRRPSLEDRASLHYVEAVLAELLRVTSPSPMAPIHRAVTETYLNGYLIPKDTSLIINLYSLFQDKEHWGDPEVFRPERFLDSSGRFVKDEWLIPFGLGKRVCLGETLARSTVFLFFTSMLQEFSFSVPDGDPLPSRTPLSGFTIAPQPFRVKVTKR